MATQSRSTRLVRFRSELDRYSIFAATAIFTLITAGWELGEITIPAGLLVLACYPLALLAIDQLYPQRVFGRELRGSAAWSALVLIAFEAVPTLTASGQAAFALPVAIGVGILVAKRPAEATVAVAFISAVAGSFQAFIGFDPFPLVDVLMAGIWLTLLARVVLGRPYQFVLWPAVIAAVTFALISVVNLALSDNTAVAWIGFRTTVWYMLGFIALAYVGWSRETYRRIALGMVAMTALVAGYAVLRWVIGPAGPERVLAETVNRINVDPVDKHLRTVGSFFTGHQLSFWAAFMAPFCVAVGLWLTGWKQVAALATAGVAVLAIIASEARGPLPGFVAGLAVVLLIYQAGRAFPGFKAGLVVAGALAVAGLTATAVIVADDDPEEFGRYARIINPETEPTYIQRQLKWEQVTNAIDEHPFGHGIGAGGAGQLLAGTEILTVSTVNIDSTYLMIAFEQGVPVLVLFILASAGLMISLGIAATRTASREAAAIGMGACGTLASMLVSFYSALYIQALPVISGWLVVGVGLSYFVARDRSQRVGAPPADRRVASSDAVKSVSRDSIHLKPGPTGQGNRL